MFPNPAGLPGQVCEEKKSGGSGMKAFAAVWACSAEAAASLLAGYSPDSAEHCL